MDAAFRVGRLDGGARGAGHALTKERADAYARDLGDKVWLLKVGGSAQSLGFNTLRPNPLQDVRVRRAIALWMDKEASIPTVSGGFGDIPAILDIRNPFTNPDMTTWPGWNKATRERDRAEAKRLMAEAGVPSGGAKVTLIVPRRWTDRGEFASGQLAGLGIDVKITLTDEAGWDRGRVSLDFDMLYSGWVGVTIPEQLEFYLTRYSISDYAAAKHEDPKLQQAFKQLNVTASLEQRVKLWRDLERYMILEQAYVVPLISSLQVIPYRSHVKGMPLPAEGIMNDSDFATVWLDK
jgi:ABC-type transport system substrate-binding protein